MRLLRPARLIILAVVGLAVSGCATLQEIANVARLDFRLDRLAELRLAGVDLRNVRSYEDLSPVDVGRIAFAVSRNELPLEFVLDVEAANTRSDAGRARLTRMDWTLLLEGRETIAGRLDREYVVEAGSSTTIPVPVTFDLIEFFDGNATDLAELVLSLADAGGSPKNVALRAVPTIDTALGSFRYPEPILIEGTIGRP
jgi:hypothetical protein